MRQPTFITLVTLLIVGAAWGQTYKMQPFKLFDDMDKPANAIEFSTKPIVSVYAHGHWKWLDEKEEADAIGFSVSQISCDKPGLFSKDGGCHELTATVLPLVGFQVTPDSTDYDIINWRADGLTARYVGGSCKISYTIEIDFKTGSVLRTQAPTKPADKVCNIVTKASQEQLMEGDAFTLVPVDKKK